MRPNGDRHHEQLKELAKGILKREGFTDNQIFTEYAILTMGQVFTAKNRGYKRGGTASLPIFPLKVKKGLIIDVVGINEDRQVAIEVGNTPWEKKAALALFFDEVWFIPFVDIEESSSFEMREHILKETTAENLRLLGRNKYLRRKLDRLLQDRGYSPIDGEEK